MERVYIDSNIFVYAATNTEPLGERSRILLKEVCDGTIEGITSLLTLDEVLWVIQKLKNREVAVKIVSQILTFPNLLLVDVTKEIFSLALTRYSEKRIGPRDALHLATMNAKQCFIVVTNDDDFEGLKGIKRRKI